MKANSKKQFSVTFVEPETGRPVTQNVPGKSVKSVWECFIGQAKRVVRVVAL